MGTQLESSWVIKKDSHAEALEGSPGHVEPSSLLAQHLLVLVVITFAHSHVSGVSWSTEVTEKLLYSRRCDDLRRPASFARHRMIWKEHHFCIFPLETFRSVSCAFPHLHLSAPTTLDAYRHLSVCLVKKTQCHTSASHQMENHTVIARPNLSLTMTSPAKVRARSGSATATT